MNVVLVETTTNKTMVLEDITIERIQYAIAFLEDERARKRQYKRNAYVPKGRPPGRPRRQTPEPSGESAEPSGDSV